MNPNVINVWLSMKALLEGMEKPEEREITHYTNLFIDVFKKQSPNFEVDPQQVIEFAKQELGIGIEKSTTISDGIDHKIWLPERKKEIKWDFWNRYRRYLLEVRHLPTRVITNMDELSQHILGLLENPLRPGVWDRRGMVVGNVQSGKTGNYIGLINRAIDSGYKLIIVLAGIHNSLRSQTQWRIDEGVTGINTNQENALKTLNTYFGVMNLTGETFLPILPVTTSMQNGDFNRRVAMQLNAIPHENSPPIILVIKKHGSVLDNVRQWLDWATNGNEEEKINVPTLLIDDEADYASINTKILENDEGEKIDPTAINRKIRYLLEKCERSAYVGYTATPFANIFISHNEPHPKYGEDLFPRSFIINLPAPSNYIGPARIFGLTPTDDMSLMDPVERLDLTYPVKDYEISFPDRHKNTHEVMELPDSLIKAIHTFILSTAVRKARKQVAHNSMLVHVTRFVDVQNQVYKLVEEERKKLKDKLISHKANHAQSIIQTLKKLWDTDFEPRMNAIQNHPEVQDANMTRVSWAEVQPQLLDVIDDLQVRSINGTSGDVLDYFQHSNGLTVIAIGGDKLSRGLTLEGLTVSYYLRASKMYDTLMQMGRWFGYRPGYLDVCRVFTTPQLIEWYERITLASEELRSEFEKMVNSGATPKEYGLKVRTSPEGLQISAANKMRSSTKMYVTYSGALIQNVAYHKDKQKNAQNYQNLVRLIEQLKTNTSKVTYEQKKASHLWRGAPTEVVLKFLENYQWNVRSPKSKPDLLAKYIRKSMARNELTHWNIALISKQSGQDPVSIAGMPVRLLERKDREPEDQDAFVMLKQNVYSPSDEWIDLSETQYEAAKKKTLISKQKLNPDKVYNEQKLVPSGYFVRKERSAKLGLLLLYTLDHRHNEGHDKFFDDPVVAYAISFPSSNKQIEVEYQVNDVYYKLFQDED